MTTVIKEKIMRSDHANWDGLTHTTSRKDSTGGTITGLKHGMEVDVLQVYGGGVNYTKSTIQKCIDAIGASRFVTLVFNPGTWTIDESITIGSNFTCRLPNGVIFNVSSGKTLTFSGPTIRDGDTWTSGSGTVTGRGAVSNTHVGDSALSTTTGVNNTAVGNSALKVNTTGTQNTAVGASALTTNTTGANNTAVGSNALTASTTASNNIAVGTDALLVNTTGTDNTAVGTNALDSNTTASNNTAVGRNALTANTTGTNNTAVGTGALLASTTANNNTTLGSTAGDSITTGFNLTCIGFDSDASSATASNEITLGNASVATLRCQVTTITALSDARDKKDVKDIGLGLSFVQKLKPVKFKWAMRDGTEKPDQFEPGFIAQDFQQVQIEENAEWMGLVYESNPDKLEATPGKLIPILVKAIQELSERVRQLEQVI